MSDELGPARAWVFGDDIDTDQIAPSRFIVSSDPDELAAHAFNDLRPAFAGEVNEGEFVVAGENFGGGSSREHAPLALLGVGIDAVIARSFARIFFRNCINIGLPVLVCPRADEITDGETISVRVGEGAVVNHATGDEYTCDGLPPFLRELVDQGGLEAYTRNRLAE